MFLISSLGTGKTNTLVALLRILFQHKLRTHASAPTNAAICELMKRFIFAMRSQDVINFRPANILLVGNLKRLKIAEENILMDFHFESRIERIREAIFNLPLKVISMISYLNSVYSPGQDEGQDEVKFEVQY